MTPQPRLKVLLIILAVTASLAACLAVVMVMSWPKKPDYMPASTPPPALTPAEEQELKIQEAMIEIEGEDAVEARRAAIAEQQRAAETAKRDEDRLIQQEARRRLYGHPYHGTTEGAITDGILNLLLTDEGKRDLAKLKAKQAETVKEEALQRQSENSDIK